MDNLPASSAVLSSALKSRLKTIVATLDIMEVELYTSNAAQTDTAMLRKVLRLAQHASFDMHKLIHHIPANPSV